MFYVIANVLLLWV